MKVCPDDAEQNYMDILNTNNIQGSKRNGIQLRQYKYSESMDFHELSYNGIDNGSLLEQIMLEACTANLLYHLIH